MKCNICKAVGNHETIMRVVMTASSAPSGVIASESPSIILLDIDLCGGCVKAIVDGKLVVPFLYSLAIARGVRDFRIGKPDPSSDIISGENPPCPDAIPPEPPPQPDEETSCPPAFASECPRCLLRFGSGYSKTCPHPKLVSECVVCGAASGTPHTVECKEEARATILAEAFGHIQKEMQKVYSESGDYCRQCRAADSVMSALLGECTVEYCSEKRVPDLEVCREHAHMQMCRVKGCEDERTEGSFCCFAHSDDPAACVVQS